jgi:polysaccharide pyruvyl transferase WcaK-like protein
MKSTVKRIAIFGNFGIPNFGNTATLEAMLVFLKQAEPGAQIACICTSPETVEHDQKILALPINSPGPPRLRKFRNLIYPLITMRKFDLLIIPGTGILCDFSSPPLGIPYKVFRWCLAARLWGIRIAFVSVGAGPVHHPMSGWFIKWSASTAQYRSYRNKFSKSFLKGLGLNTDADPVYPDLVFGLPLGPPRLQKPSEPSRLTVGVGIMHYHGWRAHERTDDSIYDEYRRSVGNFVLWLLDQGHRVRLLTGDTYDEIAVNDLKQFVLAERAALPDDSLLTDAASSYRNVIEQTADVDIVVASRYHSLIFAIILGKPAISIGYSEYHGELIREMGLGSFYQHSDRLKAETLVSQFKELVSNRKHYESAMLTALVQAREALATQEDTLRRFMSQAGERQRGNS